jgi:TolA-binding protein
VNFFVNALIGLAMLAVLAPAPGRAESNDLQSQVERPVAEAIEIRQATQKAEVQWREERQQMAAAYDQLQQEQVRLEARRKDLQEALTTARSRVGAKQAQLEAIARITDQVAPFLEEQHQRLARRIEADLPFLSAERRQRLENLKTLLDDPGVAVSERLRKVFEALLVEAEYGNTIEVYQENIAVGGRVMLANIFRLGRVGLYYQSLDRHTCGFYNIAESAWQPLDAKANRTLQTAIDIGTKRRPVEILNMPLGRIAAS